MNILKKTQLYLKMLGDFDISETSQRFLRVFEHTCILLIPDPGLVSFKWSVARLFSWKYLENWGKCSSWLFLLSVVWVKIYFLKVWKLRLWKAFQLDSVRFGLSAWVGARLKRLTHWHDTHVQGLRVCRNNITQSSQQNFRQLFFSYAVLICLTRGYKDWWWWQRGWQRQWWWWWWNIVENLKYSSGMLSWHCYCTLS